MWLALSLTPGVQAELTGTDVQAGYSNTTLGRFKAQKFQKLGGWVKAFPSILSGSPLTMNSWEDFEGYYWLGVGTTTSLDVFTGTMSNGVLQSVTHTDITPQVFLSNSTTVNCTTTAANSLVTIVDTAISGVTPFCSVYFNTPISIDGIILSGIYPVVAQLSATSYTIQANTNGLAGVTNGGSVPQFTTAGNSAAITITLPYHGLFVGGNIILPLPKTIAGLTLQGSYSVQSVTDGNNFVINSPYLANSTVANSYYNAGNAAFKYYISAGPTPPSAGYSTGNYSAGLYGIGQPLSAMTGTPITANDWTLGNWGQDLVATQSNGPIFYWPPDSGIGNALVIPNSPPFNSGAFISTSQQIMIAYGSSTYNIGSIGVSQNPLLIRWCDSQDFTDWIPSPSNQAGDFTIPTGSRIVGGTALPQINIIWTDIDAWGMSYTNPTFVFATTKIGSNCGLIGRHAFSQLAGNVYWLGPSNIFMLSGGSVSSLPCSVWDIIFQDINLAYANLCWVGSNTLYNEVIFAYCSLIDNVAYPTRYVKIKS